MKLRYIKSIAAIALLTLGMTSCEDFLDRPNEDGYNTGNYYQTDAQCYAGVNYLYNAPWYDFQRGYFCVGEGLSGNYRQGSISANYTNFSVNGTDEQLATMSASLWSVVAHSTQVYNNLKNASGPSEAVKNQCMGECLVWKSLAYFFLVRSFGEVPIIHDGSQVLADGSYTNIQKTKRADVYEYIIMTLEKAMEMLPKSTASGRLDYYSAEGLLAKTYLTKAGVSGSLSKDDLDKAASYARDVIQNSSYELESNYEDIFLLKNMFNREGMIVWRWTADGSNWTRQNSLQSDLGLSGMDDWAACWGDWGGFTPDCQLAFGVNLLENQPDSWINNPDKRLHATMMLPGFKYDQFWQDKGGFDYRDALYGYKVDGSKYRLTNEGINSCTGTNTVKHIYGNTFDHQQGAGCPDGRMASSVPSFILRFSDMYLILAEAKLLAANIGNPLTATTSDAEAVDAFYTVRHRAIQGYAKPASISFMDIWKERRLEFCMEGDRWYDFVRVSYYDMNFCKTELEAQKRCEIFNLAPLYETYYESGRTTWDLSGSGVMYATNESAPLVPETLMKTDPDSGKPYLIIPPYQEDVVFNAAMAVSADAVHVDVRSTFSY